MKTCLLLFLLRVEEKKLSSLEVIKISLNILYERMRVLKTQKYFFPRAGTRSNISKTYGIIKYFYNYYYYYLLLANCEKNKKLRR